MPTLLDNSTLSSLASCTTQAMVRYHLGLVTTKAKAEDAPKLAGKAIHAGIAHHLRGGTIDECLRVIEVMYRRFAETEVPQKDKRMLWPNIARVSASWLERNPVTKLPFAPLMVEVPFQAPVEGTDLVLTGLIDCVAVDRLDGRVYIVEHKTTGQRAEWWMKQWQFHSQLSQYVYGAQHDPAIQRAIGHPIVGAFVNKIDLTLMPSDVHRKCREHGNVTYNECGPLHANHQIQRFTRSQAQIDNWLESVYRLTETWNTKRALVEHIDDVEKLDLMQEGFFNGSCIWCDLKDWCLTGRKNHHVLRAEPWAPIQGKGDE